MRELIVGTREIRGEDGGHCRCTYSVLIDEMNVGRFSCESYGVRLPADYAGPVPPQMLLMDVPEGEYLVFEHGPFCFETENGARLKSAQAKKARIFTPEEFETYLD